MSVYGGFSTRKMETRYNQLLLDLLQLMQAALCKFVAQEQIDQQLFKSHFHKVYQAIKGVETRKYLNPKFAPVLQPLAEACYDHIDGCVSAVELQIPRSKRLFVSKKIQRSARASEEKNYSLETPSSNHMPVTQLYNMRWPDQPIEPPSLNVIDETPKGVTIDIGRKRVKSGVTHKNVMAGEGGRPTTSVQKKYQMMPGLQTIENELEDLKEKSQTIYLAQEQPATSHRMQHRFESYGAIAQPRKKLYDQLQKYNSTLDISQHMAPLPAERRKSNRMYRIAKLF